MRWAGWLIAAPVRALRRDLAAASPRCGGSSGSAPYEGWKLGPQVAGSSVHASAAPQHHIWLAARRG